jgi:murein endopeptidase
MPADRGLLPFGFRMRPQNLSLALLALVTSALVMAGLLLEPAASRGPAPPAPPPPAQDAEPLQAEALADEDPNAIETRRPPIDWRPSRALGQPFAGRLVNGVRLPPRGQHFVTWDPIRKQLPNRGWRRWGTDRLLRLLLRIGREYRRANPGAPRLVIGDLSRPRGGDFGPQFGGIGHASHQNGLDADIYYPRRDRREIAPRVVGQVDLPLAQDLVSRFVRAGAELVFVGPATPLRGPRKVVMALVNHDDHLHVRL